MHVELCPMYGESCRNSKFSFFHTKYLIVRKWLQQILLMKSIQFILDTSHKYFNNNDIAIVCKSTKVSHTWWNHFMNGITDWHILFYYRRKRSVLYMYRCCGRIESKDLIFVVVWERFYFKLYVRECTVKINARNVLLSNINIILTHEIHLWKGSDVNWHNLKIH